MGLEVAIGPIERVSIECRSVDGQNGLRLTVWGMKAIRRLSQDHPTVLARQASTSKFRRQSVEQVTYVMYTTTILGQWWESFFCFLVQIKYSSSLSFLLFEHSHQAGVKVLVGEILGAQPGEAGVEVLAPFSPTYCPFSCHKIPCIQKKCPA